MKPLGREVLVSAVVNALLEANTIAGVNVYAERDWPLSDPQLPSILVRAPTERKESLVRGAPQFTTTASVHVLARVSGQALNGPPAVSGAAVVSGMLATIARQIELAIMTAGSPVQQIVQQFVSVDTETRTTSEAANTYGDCLIIFSCEFYEEYPPCGGFPLLQVGLEITQPPGDAPTVLAGANIATPGQPIIFQP